MQLPFSEWRERPETPIPSRKVIAKDNKILISSSVPGTVRARYRTFEGEENKAPDLKDFAIMLERGDWCPIKHLLPSSMGTGLGDGGAVERTLQVEPKAPWPIVSH